MKNVCMNVHWTNEADVLELRLPRFAFNLFDAIFIQRFRYFTSVIPSISISVFNPIRQRRGEVKTIKGDEMWMTLKVVVHDDDDDDDNEKEETIRLRDSKLSHSEAGNSCRCRHRYCCVCCCDFINNSRLHWSVALMKRNLMYSLFVSHVISNKTFLFNG